MSWLFDLAWEFRLLGRESLIKFTRFLLRIFYMSSISLRFRSLSFSFQSCGSKILSLKSNVSLSILSSLSRSYLSPTKSVPTRAYLSTYFITCSLAFSSKISSTVVSGFYLSDACMIFSRLFLNDIIFALCFASCEETLSASTCFEPGPNPYYERTELM